MQNILINMCEEFYHARLRNDRALGYRKSDNNKNPKNKNKNNVRIHWEPVYGCNKYVFKRLLKRASVCVWRTVSGKSIPSSGEVAMHFGVPQGSDILYVARGSFFAGYDEDVSDIFRYHGIRYHLFADDMQGAAAEDQVILL